MLTAFEMYVMAIQAAAVDAVSLNVKRLVEDAGARRLGFINMDYRHHFIMPKYEKDDLYIDLFNILF
jgi:hypothetical protein